MPQMMVSLKMSALRSDIILPNCSDISAVSPVTPESTSFMELGFALTRATPVTLTTTLTTTKTALARSRPSSDRLSDLLTLRALKPPFG